MKISLHQPNYLPYTGFFQKMALSDVFVILDTVQFSKGSYTQRTNIRSKDGSLLLTIPINKKYNFEPIKDVRLPENDGWLNEHRLSMIFHYSKCKYMDKEFVNEYFSNLKKFETLQEFNEFGIFYLKDKFGIQTEIIRASELCLNSNLKSTDLMIQIVKSVGGDTYISGMGGKKYLAEEKFLENNITLEYFEFEGKEYPQRWKGFEPYVSAIDLLFNLGPHSIEYIQK
jgi:hypothetical protein